jgi:hypothetical protein
MFGVLRGVSLLRFGLFLGAWASVVLASFTLFGRLIDDGPSKGKTELACAKARLEAMWHMQLPADAEVVGSVPGGSGVVSADWELKALGCPSAVYTTATLKLPE